MKKDSAIETAELVIAITPRMIQTLASVMRENEDPFPTVQYRVLRLLINNPTGLSSLAKQLDISKASLSETIKLMVERGWIEKINEISDRRRSLLTVTANGQNQIDHFENRIRDHITNHLKKIAPDDVDIIKSGMLILIEYFKSIETGNDNK